MCFGGGGSASNTSTRSPTVLASDPRAFFRWWKPPEIETPTLRLHEEALGKKELKRKREGMKRFQIPLAPNNQGSGLGIPRRGGRN